MSANLALILQQLRNHLECQPKYFQNFLNVSFLMSRKQQKTTITPLPPTTTTTMTGTYQIKKETYRITGQINFSCHETFDEGQ